MATSSTAFRLLIIFLFVQLNQGYGQKNSSIELRSIPLKKHFNSNNYKGGIQNWSIDQDSSGFVYVANNEGLLEFDGSNWEIFEVPNCRRVRAVKVDEANRIFVGGQGQIGFFEMKDGGFGFNSLLGLLPPDQQVIAETWSIIAHNGKMYFLTESRFLVYDGNAFVALPVPGYIQQVFKSNGKIFAQVYGAGLFTLIDDRFDYIEGSDKIPEIVVGLPHSTGHFFISRSGDFYSFDESNFHQIEIPVDLGTITTAIKLSNGNLVIGTQNSGLYIFDNSLILKQHLTKNEGLSDRTIKALYEDGFNNLWLALHNGIDYLELSLPFSLINDDVGLEGTGYAACLHNNQIFLGTNNGLFKQKAPLNETNGAPYKLVQGSQGQVYNFSIVGDELFLHHDRGAFIIGEDELKQIHDIGSWKFLPTRVPDLLLGGDYQGISYFRKRNNTWSKVGVVPDLNESSRILEYENDSILWMTHNLKGAFLLRFDKDMNLLEQPKIFGKKDGLPSNSLVGVYPINNDLVFTTENGIYNFDYEKEHFVPNVFFEKWLGEQHVSEIESDGSNSIYYIQKNEIGIIEEEKYGIYRKKTGLFKHINSLISDDLPNISVLDNANVLIGAKEGFIVYNPLQGFAINENFKVILRSVDIKNDDDSTTRILPGRNVKTEIAANQSMQFNFTSPYFDGFEELNYSYRLVPLQENWSEWSPQGKMKYPYLPPGNYAFEVKAKNVYEQQSKISAFSFRVMKPWYLSEGAIFFYIFFGLASVAMMLLWQKYKHSVESSRYVKQSEEAIKTKDLEIDHISKQSKSEIDRLMSEKLKTELNLKNDQLTTITMHLMNTSDFLQSVRDKILTITQAGNNKTELTHLIKKIDDQISDHNSWDEFAYHFDQVHSGYLKKLSENNVKLSPREIKLASFLRMNMSTKEISKLLNISDRGVELARYRLRKKLNLSRDQNLVEYLIDLDD
jgi:DNA-binding CsgD family transcriptional regulator